MWISRAGPGTWPETSVCERFIMMSCKVAHMAAKFLSFFGILGNNFFRNVTGVYDNG